MAWTVPALAGEVWPCDVVRVYDGDTIQVRRDSGELVKVRLWGVDCAEARNPRAEEAEEFTRLRRPWAGGFRSRSRTGTATAGPWPRFGSGPERA